MKVRLFLTSTQGGVETHFGTIENVVANMFDGSPLYLVRTCGEVIAVAESAMEPVGKHRKNR